MSDAGSYQFDDNGIEAVRGIAIPASAPRTVTGYLSETPSAFIQWKGTNVCMDVYCTCGYDGHADGFFVSAVKCPQCGREWVLPHTIPLQERTDGDDAPAPHTPDPSDPLT